MNLNQLNNVLKSKFQLVPHDTMN